MSNIIRWFFITVIGILIYFAANLAYMICVLKITTISKIVALDIPGFILYFYHLLIIIIRASTEPYALGGPAGLIGSLILSYLLLEICDDNISLFKREKFGKFIKLNDEFIDACKNGDIDKVKYLLSSPELKEHADIHAFGDAGFQWACMNGHLEVVKYLLTSPDLKKHADIHEGSDAGFQWACNKGYLDIVKYLLTSTDLKKHADIHSNSDLGFRWACENGRLEVVKYLLTSPELKEHADIHAFGDAGFQWACMNGHLEIVKYLLTSPEIKEHANIHADDCAGFRLACHNDHLAVVKFHVFDMNLELSMETRKNINSLNNKDEIFNLFDKREFEKKLNNSLKVKEEKPVKRTKI